MTIEESCKLVVDVFFYFVRTSNKLVMEIYMCFILYWFSHLLLTTLIMYAVRKGKRNCRIIKYNI
jgi:hypothetical protein